jgi:hypothetical protein
MQQINTGLNGKFLRFSNEKSIIFLNIFTIFNQLYNFHCLLWPSPNASQAFQFRSCKKTSWFAYAISSKTQKLSVQPHIYSWNPKFFLRHPALLPPDGKCKFWDKFSKTVGNRNYPCFCSQPREFNITVCHTFYRTVPSKQFTLLHDGPILPTTVNLRITSSVTVVWAGWNFSVPQSAARQAVGRTVAVVWSCSSTVISLHLAFKVFRIWAEAGVNIFFPCNMTTHQLNS